MNTLTIGSLLHKYNDPTSSHRRWRAELRYHQKRFYLLQSIFTLSQEKSDLKIVKVGTGSTNLGLCSSSFFTEMTYSSALLLTLAFTLAVSANPVVIRDSPITLPITKRLNANGTFNLLERDQARVKGLKQFARQKISGTLVDAVVASVPVTNQAVDYVANVSIL